ncbi:MAG TPA: ADOP family duplicated permease [Vicinamibacterales bacterium]|nr:ADOP family duplicated permease [Vicinamibacterales bacterium]
MAQMLRQASRVLFKSPGPSVAAIASLALAIGANATILTLIDAVVLRPLPVAAPARLVAVTAGRQVTMSYPAYRDFEQTSRSFSGLAAHARRQGAVTMGSLVSVGEVQVVSGNYFSVLGVPATHGRVLAASDDVAGADPAVVLSAAFWQQAFGGAPVTGRSLQINGATFTIVGVAPPGFRGLDLGANPLGWIAVHAFPRMATGNYLLRSIDQRGWGWLRLAGRLRDGATPEQARRELTQLAARQEKEHPRYTPSPFEIAVTPMIAAATGLRTRADLVRFIALLAAVVLAVLGIACANVTGLLLARAVSRRREIAVRIALGAARRRLVIELMIESVLLAVAGGALGLLAVLWAIDLLGAVQLPGGVDMSSVDARISGFTIIATAALALLAAVTAGIVPAVQSTRADVVSGLKDHSVAGRAGRQRLRATLVATQVTLSLVLLVGTGLFARTLQATLAGDLGFDPRHVAYAATNVGLQRYDADRAATFFEEVFVHLRSIPELRAAAWTVLIPSSNRDTESIRVPGYVSPTGRNPFVGVNVVTSGYFETMAIPLVRGRGFSDADTRDAPPVVVVNEAAAARFWNGDALGRRFSINRAEVTIVGVARNVAPEPGATPEPFVYGCLTQLPAAGLGVVHLVARAHGDAASLVPRLRDAIRAAGPTAPVLEARTLDEQLRDLLGAQRSVAVLMGLLSVVAVALSVGGIYAMVSFWVTERTREFGVRMALGASRGTIRRLALRHAATAVGAGIAAGLPIAIVLGRASRRMLFDLSPMDPVAFGGAILLIVAAAFAASLIPAHRAAATTPLQALRAGNE